MQIMLPKGKAGCQQAFTPLVRFLIQMEIIVNQNKMSVADETSVQTLMDQLLGEKQKGIAVAIGENIVSRMDWSNSKLKEKDTITIITATQGG